MKTDRSWPWLLGFAALSLVMFHAFWDHTIIAADSFCFFAPNKAIWLQGAREGAIYGWNPWLFLGVPFTAEVQAGVFYPFNLFFLVLPFGVAHRLFLLVHYPLAAFFTFLLLRRMRLSAPAAALGAVAFAFSGYMVSQHAMVRMVLGATWAPLTVYFTLRAEEEGWKWALAAGAALALAVLAGDPETALVAAAIAGGRLVYSGARSGKMSRALGLLAAVAASSLALSAAQVLPTAEMMRQSSRAAGLPLSEMLSYSLHPLQLLEFIWPTPFGVQWPEMNYWGGFMLDTGFTNLPWSASNYLGLPVIVLAAVGLIAGRRPLNWWLLGGVVLFLLLALGRHTPVYALLSHVPVLNAFRYPSKYVAWLTLCLALAAALGAERVIGWLEEKPDRVSKTGTAYGAAIFVVALAAYIGLRIALDVGMAGLPDNVFMKGLLHLNKSVFQLTGINVILAVVLFGSKFSARPFRDRRVALTLLGFLIVLDLYLANVTIMPAGPADIFDFEPVAAAALRADHEPFGFGRVYREDWDFSDPDPAPGLPLYSRQARWQRTTLRRNHSAAAGIEDAALYGSYEIREGLDLFNHGLAPQVMALYNVRWLILAPDAPAVTSMPSQTVRLDRANNFRLDRLSNIWPRAYFVPGARRAADEAEALALLKRVDLTREAVITGGPEVAAAPAGGPALAAAKVARYEPDRVELEVNAPSAGWLVLNDRFYPGWRATLDGAEVEVRRANVVVRAVAVPAGPHRVVFAFRSRPVTAGRWISGLAWLLLAGVFFGERFARRGPCRNPKESEKSSRMKRMGED